MKRILKLSKWMYVILCFTFFYAPIFVTMIFSFNSSKSLTKFTGFSLKWYTQLIENSEMTFVPIEMARSVIDDLVANSMDIPEIPI